jgi:hypothetical protein
MNRTFDERLIGRWTSDPDDQEGIRHFGRATIEFTEGGDLTYTIHLEHKDQKIFLIYTTEDGTLITDQPSKPGTERTRYSLASDGRLALWFGGQRSTYIRLRS